jgi:hypothetical protein
MTLRIPTGGGRDQIGTGRAAGDMTFDSPSTDVIEAPVDEGQNCVLIETFHGRSRVSDQLRRVFSLVEPL